MYNNTFGNIFRLTSFGESHGKAIGGVIDGFPAGIAIDMDFIQQELDRRRPGQSAITTARKEADQVEFLSGIYEGVSTGCSIGFVVWNTNQHSNDYDNMKDVFRPSHADFTYTQKYGIRDHRGGGRSSARETIARVVAGALAKLALRQLGVRITAFTSQVGEFKLDKDYTAYDLSTMKTIRYAVRIRNLPSRWLTIFTRQKEKAILSVASSAVSYKDALSDWDSRFSVNFMPP